MEHEHDDFATCNLCAQQYQERDEYSAEEKNDIEKIKVALQALGRESSRTLSQADGFAPGTEEDEGYGKGSTEEPQWLKDAPPFGDEDRAYLEPVGERGDEHGQTFQEAEAQEYLFVLGLAERVLASPGVTGEYGPIRPSGEQAGTLKAFSELYGALEEMIGRFAESDGPS